MTGYIVHREGDEVITDLERHHVRHGDTLIVFFFESEVYHPVTNELVRVRLKPTGVIFLNEVGEISSSGKIISGGDDIAVGQFVRIVSGKDIPKTSWWEEGTWWRSTKRRLSLGVPPPITLPFPDKPRDTSVKVIRVPQDQLTIQAGIDAASDGYTVLVADGTYRGNGNVNIDFKGKAITVKSINGPNVTIIDCENVENTRGFIFQSGETLSSRLDGFTIKNGKHGFGGSIQCHRSSSPTIANNIITGNSANAHGGGIHCRDSSEPVITNNLITHNSANDRGGGIYCVSSSPTIINNAIISNLAAVGGGIDCRNPSNAKIINNVISQNVGHSHGGGINCMESNPWIINNTIVGNSSANGGGICCEVRAFPTVVNTILWENTAPSGNEILLESESNITVTYSNIQGGWEGEGNMDANPLFFDAENADYRLQKESPCIDKGTLEKAPLKDIEGVLRNGSPDIGAYEWHPLLEQNLFPRTPEASLP